MLVTVLSSILALASLETDEGLSESFAALQAAKGDEKPQAEERFLGAFLSADWDAIDSTEHRALLETGLLLAAQHGMEEDPRLALRAYRALVQRLPDAREASDARVVYIPLAQALAGDREGALAYLDAALPEAEGVEKIGMHLAKGDLLAIVRDYLGARVQYQSALAELPADLARNDPRARLRRSATLRDERVGRAAPELSRGTWFGAEPRTLRQLEGGVVVLDFWATWCGPCRRVMPSLSRLQEKHRAAGLHVLGVTRPYAYGYLPGGERVEDMNLDAFLAHVAEYRELAEVAYTFIVGTKEDFESYGIRNLPTVIVLDREGIVMIANIGATGEPLVRLAVETELARSEK